MIFSIIQMTQNIRDNAALTVLSKIIDSVLRNSADPLSIHPERCTRLAYSLVTHLHLSPWSAAGSDFVKLCILVERTFVNVPIPSPAWSERNGRAIAAAIHLCDHYCPRLTGLIFFCFSKHNDPYNVIPACSEDDFMDLIMGLLPEPFSDPGPAITKDCEDALTAFLHLPN